jgi:hypothetical protein
MTQNLLTCAVLLVCQVHATSQSQQPVWDIGTKWIYDFVPSHHLHTYITNEITDTTEINGYKLYVVESEPQMTGVRFLHYADSKVYNYNESLDLLELLYDFTQTQEYHTDYRPICDPAFPYDSISFQRYRIVVDSVTEYIMPDNTIRTLQYVVPLDTLVVEMDTLFITDLERTVLDRVGFMQGGIHYTHNWEIGMYICDEFANYVGQLRCFSDDSTSYNFVGYPCDSTWIITDVDDIQREIVRVFPNPTSDLVMVSGIPHDVNYEIYSPIGVLLERGETDNHRIKLDYSGFLVLRLYLEGTWLSRIVLICE